MLRKSSMIVAAILITVFSGSVLFAQQERPKPRRMPYERMERMHHRGQMGMMKGMAALQLTDEQKQKMMDLHLALQKEMVPLKAKLATLRADLGLLMTADKPDLKKIEAKQNQIGQVQTQMRMAFIRHQLKVREMLTPEQRKKFDSLILSGRHGMRHFFGRGGRGKGPGPGMPMR